MDQARGKPLTAAQNITTRDDDCRQLNNRTNATNARLNSATPEIPFCQTGGNKAGSMMPTTDAY